MSNFINAEYEKGLTDVINDIFIAIHPIAVKSALSEYSQNILFES